MRRLIFLACAGGMVCFAVLAAWLAYTELQFRRDTPGTIAWAAELDRFAPPAGYFERLADLDPEFAERWLDAALRANSRLSSAWIALGLAAERAGEMDQAERDLLQAARIDRQYLPAWTLANFYFRRQSADRFWTWAQRAASLTYDEFRPLLALAHAVEPRPRAALEKLGGGDRLLRADLDDLATRGSLDDAQVVARLIPPRPIPGDASRLLELAERQIRAGNAAYALELWNAAASPLNPNESPALANGDLLQSPTGIAFDWRLLGGEGATPGWRPSQLTFSFSGNQPESCPLLEQILPLARAKRYRLRFEYFTAGLASPTGIVWDLDGTQGPVLEPADAWLPAAVVLSTAHRGANLSRLRLLYRS
jgi:tetratricopeptide (TPR) repeat protein